MWKRDYLTLLREFHRTSGHNSQIIKKGHVVVVHDDQPRLTWKLAVVEDLIVGNDGLVRASHIRTANHHTSRPIIKLYPLEVTSEVEDCMNNTNESNSTKLQDVPTSEPTRLTTNTTQCPNTKRVKREAAKRAEQRIADWTQVLCRPPEDVTEL